MKLKLNFFQKLQMNVKVIATYIVHCGNWKRGTQVWPFQFSFVLMFEQHRVVQNALPLATHHNDTLENIKFSWNVKSTQNFNSPDAMLKAAERIAASSFLRSFQRPTSTRISEVSWRACNCNHPEVFLPSAWTLMDTETLVGDNLLVARALHTWVMSPPRSLFDTASASVKQFWSRVDLLDSSKL